MRARAVAATRRDTTPTASVIDAARRGDDEALACVYRWLDGDVVAYLASRAPAAAEDIASDTWVSVARSLRAFEGGHADLRRWVFSIAKKRLLDHHRRERRRPTVAPESAIHTMASDVNTADEALGATHGIVASMLASLPRNQAEVVSLRVLSGLDVDEVAALVNRRPATVRVQVHRALRRLAREMAVHDLDTLG